MPSDANELKSLRIIDKEELLGLVPYSLQHIYRLMKVGRFPQRVQVGPNRVGWRLAEIEDWLQSRPKVAA